jgi:hypothetical protein
MVDRCNYQGIIEVPPWSSETFPYNKIYFNPIPQDAIDRNEKLIQNWGY